jgi:hypothetical protein
VKLGAGDGPRSVRVRPSSPKHGCDRRATSTGKVAVERTRTVMVDPGRKRHRRSQISGQLESKARRTPASSQRRMPEVASRTHSAKKRFEGAGHGEVGYALTKPEWQARTAAAAASSQLGDRDPVGAKRAVEGLVVGAETGQHRIVGRRDLVAHNHQRRRPRLQAALLSAAGLRFGDGPLSARQHPPPSMALGVSFNNGQETSGQSRPLQVSRVGRSRSTGVAELPLGTSQSMRQLTALPVRRQRRAQPWARSPRAGPHTVRDTITVGSHEQARPRLGRLPWLLIVQPRHRRPGDHS